MSQSVTIAALLACAAVWFASRLAPPRTDGGAPSSVRRPAVVCQSWSDRNRVALGVGVALVAVLVAVATWFVTNGPLIQ
jgi:hypothetical protein